MPKGKSDTGKIGNLLILLGGIVGLLQGILLFLGVWAWGFIPIPFLDNWISGIILIVISLAVLATNGAVKIQKLKFGNNWIVYFILGILMIIFKGDLAGILVIIGAILLLL
jgi:hypothetical protein